MRTAKYLAGAALLILSLAACGSTPAFNGSRTGNDEQFLLDYTMFNTTDSQELTAQAGDQIRADITVDGGNCPFRSRKRAKNRFTAETALLPPATSPSGSRKAEPIPSP